MKKLNEIKLFILIMVGLVFAIIFIIISNDVLAPILYSSGDFVPNTEKPAKPTYTKSLEARLYSYTDTVFDLLNNKEYDKAYALLDEGYKNTEFDSFNHFSAYMDTYFKDSYSPTFSNYYKLGNGGYIIFLNLMKSNYSADDLLKPYAPLYDSITIYEKAENDFKFAFNGFISSTKLQDTPQTSKDFTIQLDRLTKYAESRKLYFTITNNSDSEINMSSFDFSLKFTLTEPSIPFAVFTIPAHSTKSCVLTYNMNFDINSVEQTFVIDKLKVGDSHVSLRIPIKAKT